MFSFAHVLFSLFLVASPSLASQCKVTPYDASWPSEADWTSLNTSISGSLIRTVPVASSCYPGNPFGSKVDCAIVSSDWTSAEFHAQQPESVDFPVFTNNSCIPPGSTGYDEASRCTLRGLPQYVVNASSPEQVAVALKWAAGRDIRVIVKGTGHDLCGRSSGANSLSIWTHNLRSIEFDECWSPENSTSDETWEVVVLGSGWTWGDTYEEASMINKVVVGGGTASVGLGGWSGVGGHGPLTSVKGLGSDQMLQVTIATTEGKVYVANDYQYQDLFWAVRGGGMGIYGVVTEYVLKTYPTANEVAANIQITAAENTTTAIEAVWNASAIITNSLPDWMDQGLTGTNYIATSALAAEFVPGASSPNGPVFMAALNAFNSTPATMNASILPILAQIKSKFGTDLNIIYTAPTEYPTFYDWYNATSSSVERAVAYYGVSSARLLNKTTLTQSPISLSQKFKDLMAPQNPAVGSVLVLTMTAGKGVSSTPSSRRGAVLPAWRESYIHAVASTAVADTSLPPVQAMGEAGEWLNENTELRWEELQRGAGAYISEANQYTVDWEARFWGENYGRLKEVKGRYDPSESMVVGQMPGSEGWVSDWEEGTLCRA